MPSRRSLAAGALLLALESLPAAAAPLRPPQIPASPRYFGRAIRPVTPQTAVSLQAGHLWAGRVDGVDQQQLSLGVVAEAAQRWIGAFLHVPLWIDFARTEGVYGAGEASVAGAGDLRFGFDLRLGSWSLWGAPWTLGAGSQVTAPTGGARAVWPASPHLSAPRHLFGPAKWTASGGGALSVEPTAALSLQLNLDLIGHFRDERDHPVLRKHWLFGAVGVSGAYRLLGWLVPLLQLDLQLELVGQSELRQLLFINPAVRVEPWARVSLDLSLRIGVRRETTDEQRLSLGLSVRIALDGARR